MSAMTTLDAGKSLAAGRLFLKRRAPYVQAALLRLVFKEAPGLGTFGVTERGVCMYDPEVCKRWTAAQIGAVLLHELEHLRRKHAVRGKAINADHFGFNIAGDAEINDDLADGGWELPDEPVMPATLDAENGRLAEEYYHALKQKQQEGDGGEGQPGKGSGKGKGKGGKSKSKDADGEKHPQAGGGWCGSCAGNPVPGEPSDGGAKEGGMSDAEQARVWRQVAEAVKSHVASQGRGNVPSDMIRWAEDLTKPAKVRWQDKLARVARKAVAYRPGAVDYRFDRPSRRQAAIGYGAGKPILPVLRTPIPRVAIAVDTSGSMGTTEVERALAESKGVLRAVGADIQFVVCDAVVHGGVSRVRNVKEMASRLRGGGGTDFRPVFAALTGRRDQPEVLIFATDGQGPAPEAPPPGMAVIWLLIGAYKSAPCAWGTVVEVDD